MSIHSIQFILSQVAALAAWIFFALSYHVKRENKMILFQIISGLLYCTSYIVAGATTGFLISLFETITAYSYYKTDKDKYIYLFTLPIYILIGYFSSSSDGLFVLVPIFGSIIDGYGMIRNNKIMVITGVASNFLWIFYDLYYLEYITALGDLLLVISNLSIVVYGIYKYIKRDNVKMTMPKNLTDDELNIIAKLDEEFYDKVYRWGYYRLKELYLIEKDSYIIIKDKKNIIGYICLINTSLDVYKRVIDGDIMIDDYGPAEVRKYRKNENLYINLNSIVLKREYNNKDIVKRIENYIKKFINKKLKENYKIKEVYIYTVNELEEKIVKDLEFEKIKKITEECILYKKKIK